MRSHGRSLEKLQTFIIEINENQELFLADMHGFWGGWVEKGESLLWSLGFPFLDGVEGKELFLLNGVGEGEERLKLKVFLSFLSFCFLLFWMGPYYRFKEALGLFINILVKSFSLV